MLATDPAKALALAIVPGVVQELAIVPTEVQALVIALAWVRELETVQVAAVPEFDPVAVPLKTKSAIAAHPRGLRPLLAAAEDLAAVAETMPEQAATGAATVWAVAVTAVVVVADSTVVAVVVAEDAEDKRKEL